MILAIYYHPHTLVHIATPSSRGKRQKPQPVCGFTYVTKCCDIMVYTCTFKIFSVQYSIRRLSWLRGQFECLKLVVKECPSVTVVYFVIHFKNGTGKKLGHCKCGAQHPRAAMWTSVCGW